MRAWPARGLCCFYPQNATSGEKKFQKHHRIRNTTKTFTVKTTRSACLHAVKGKKIHSLGKFWEPLALEMYRVAIQSSPLHSYILRDPISKGSPQVHLGKCRDTLSSRPWLTMPFDSYIKDTLPTPSSAVPSEHRPEGGGGGWGHWGKGSPQSQLAEGGGPPKPHTLLLIEYVEFTPNHTEAMLCFGSNLCGKASLKNIKSHLSDWPSLEWGL